MPSHTKSFDCVPGLTLAVLFFIFAGAGTQIDGGDGYMVVWRVAALSAGLACLWGVWHLDRPSARNIAGIFSVSWTMLWSIFVVWRDPVGVDTSFKAFMFALAVLATWYWSRSPAPVVVSDKESHSAHAVATIRILPPLPQPHRKHIKWADLSRQHGAVERRVVEADG